MVTVVYSKDALDKYFSIFDQTFVDMIVRGANIIHPLQSQNYESKTSLARSLIG